MLSLSHSSIFYISIDRFTSHQRREKRSQFSKKFDPQIRNFRKKHTIILTSMTYPSQFFFFFVGIKSIDWIPPQNSSLEASIRPVLFIYPRLCKFDESGEEEGEETSMNFFPLPLFPFRINSRPNEANQSGERGDLNFSDAWPLRLTMDASIQPPGEQRNYSPSFIISNIYICVTVYHSMKRLIKPSRLLVT